MRARFALLLLLGSLLPAALCSSIQPHAFGRLFGQRAQATAVAEEENATALDAEKTAEQTVPADGAAKKQPFFSHGDGRIALVTGAGRGIGKCIADKLADSGVSHVICVSKSEGSCKMVADAINSRGLSASAHAVDVGDGAAVDALVEKLLKEHGKIDVLVNNAGITRDNLFVKMSEKDWTDVIKTNLDSCFHFCKPIVKSMSKNKFGRIINIASVVGVGGNPGQCNYAAAKAGMIGFSKALSKEVASRGVTVNAVAPGFIASDMTKVLSDDAKAKLDTQIPMGRMGTPDEVSDLVLFLASDQSQYITGKVVPVDGGMLFGAN